MSNRNRSGPEDGRRHEPTYVLGSFPMLRFRRVAYYCKATPLRQRHPSHALGAGAGACRPGDGKVTGMWCPCGPRGDCVVRGPLRLVRARRGNQLLGGRRPGPRPRSIEVGPPTRAAEAWGPVPWVQFSRQTTGSADIGQ